jgi:ribonucleoside-diphosphate reductase beta chain
MIRNLIKEDKDIAKIAKKYEDDAVKLFVDVIEQEKEWARYLFKDGSMIGLNETILENYVEWIGCKRMRALGLPCPYTVPQMNPLPWTEKWISGGNVQVAPDIHFSVQGNGFICGNVQVAPQETEISSYVVGGVKQDVDKNTLSGLSL